MLGEHINYMYIVLPGKLAIGNLTHDNSIAVSHTTVHRLFHRLFLKLGRN